MLGLLVRQPEGHLSCRTYFILFRNRLSGKDIKKERDVAVKLEVALEWSSKLEREYNVYQAISGIRGIPKILWYGMEGRYNVMVLSRLECTFEEMARLGVLNAHAVFTYAKQMVLSPCS